MNKDGGEGEGERELINFSPLKRGGLLEGGGGGLNREFMLYQHFIISVIIFDS